jgi:MFS family permease
MIDFCKISKLFYKLVNEETITAYLNLYCDRKQDRILIQSTTGLGTWVGIILSGLISDKQGRKFSLIIGLLIINVSWICKIIVI